MYDRGSDDARKWALWAHLSSLVWFPLAFVGLSFPILNILGPLIIWQMKKSEHSFVDDHGKESVNFQISVTIYTLIITVIVVIIGLVFITLIAGSSSQDSDTLALGIGLILAASLIFISVIVGIIQLALVIFAAIKANNGEMYRYPLTIRLLR